MQINFKNCALNILLSLVILITTNIIFLPLNKAALLTFIQVICISVVSWGLYIYQKWRNKKYWKSFWEEAEKDGQGNFKTYSARTEYEYSNLDDGG